MVMTRQEFARDLQTGINAHFGMSYKKHPEEWSKIYEKKTSKKAYEEQVLRVGLGEAHEKAEGGVITFDTGAEGWVARASFYTYALAFAITKEAIRDNQYDDLSEVYGRELGKALQHAKEVRGASLLNNAFDSNYIGGDGVSLCNSAHPLWAGGSFSNVLPTAADLTEEALEDAHIAIDGFVNDRGRPQMFKVKQLVIPRQLRFRAERIRGSQHRVGTALNDINALKSLGYLDKEPVINHYLIDPDAWWLQTDCELGLQFWQRDGVEKGMETDFLTGNMMYKATERYGFSFTDPRCIYGSAGSPVDN